MLDAWMRRRIDTPLDRLGRSLAAAGLRANQVTLLGFIAGVAAVPLLAVEAYWPALVLILLNRLADGSTAAAPRWKKIPAADMRQNHLLASGAFNSASFRQP